jgi:hypothetical protein
MNIYVTQNSILIEVITPKRRFGVKEPHRTPKPDSDFIGVAKTKFFGVGVEIKFFSDSELQSEPKKHYFRDRNRKKIFFGFRNQKV